MSPDRITLEDVVKAGHCIAGAKAWFVSHGFNWKDVVRNGASEADLLATGDSLAERVIAAKRSRSDG